MRIPIAVALTLVTCTCPSPAQTSPERRPVVTTPEAFLGKKVGADYFLANYTQLRSYWKKLAAESDRMQLTRIGTTSYGQPMVMAVISAPQNLAKLEHYREISQRLALAEGLTDEVARGLAADGKSVVWIDAGMHATESVAAQNIIELVYRMVGRDDAETREILANVILLVCPANPDGMELVANGYMATRRVGRLPVLYQKYIGHDNNRDHYMTSMPETVAITHQLYRHWYPQIVYNHHQSAPRGTVIFTPPFRDPFNYNFDPMVVRGIALVANHINSRFSWQSQPGVISETGASYSTWWNGGLRTTAYFHNMIGILTESFGSPTPTKLTQSLRRRLPYNDYPDPVASQAWHARQTIEYLQTSNRAILLLAARYRQDFLFNIYQMGRNSIRRGSADHWTVTPKLVAEAERRGKVGGVGGNGAGTGQAAIDATFRDPKLRDPRAYVISSKQRDPAAARRFVGVLIRSGIAVEQLTGSATIDRRRYLAGSFVVRAAQAFRPMLRDMFEPQWHPDDVGTGGQPVRPYDSAGWTPVLQMGVEHARVLDALPEDLPLRAVTLDDARQPPPGDVRAGQKGYLLAPGDSNVFKGLNRVLAAGQRVFCLPKAIKVGRYPFPRGTFFLPRSDRLEAMLPKLARELGLSFHGIDRALGGSALRLRPLRVGLFDVYGGNMATGWTQWVLERFEFPVELVFGKRILEGDLRRSFDVLLFFTGLPDPGGRGRTRRALRRGRPNRVGDEQLDKLVKALPPFADWSTVGARRVRLTKERALPVLRQFIESGGVLITAGSQAMTAARLFELPVRDGVLIRDAETGREREATSREFFVPGSLLRMRHDANSIITTGVPSEFVGVYRRGSTVFRVRGQHRDVRPIAHYPHQGETLASGWAIGIEHLRGRAAVIEAEVGKGRVYLFGNDVTYRGQPQVTIKMLCNAVLLGGAESVPTIEVK